jgi:6-phospho-beta-glucosidase
MTLRKNEAGERGCCMRNGLKMAVIGGGSSYTPELIDGLIKGQHELPVNEVWLVDVEEGKEKLAIIGRLAQRMVSKAGAPITIHWTLDRQAALKDAAFVITQFRVGGLAARIKDETIPLKYDVIGQETNGPGGLFKALRTIPVILDICEEMEELCPEAWLINFTNPAGIVTEAVLRHSRINKVIGLCNGPISISRGVAAALNVEPARVRIDFAGLNHMSYGLKTTLDGEDISSRVIAMLAGRGEDGQMIRQLTGVEWVPEFVEALGVIPCGYHRYYYQPRTMLATMKREAAQTGTRAEVVKRLEDELFALYQDPNLNVKPKQLEGRGGAYYSEAAVQLLRSIYTDKRDIQVVNTRNQGAIAGIPDESAVEVSCVITKEGPRPLVMGELPVAVRGLVQQIKSFERVTVEAAVSGDYRTALLAMVINPLVPSDAVAKQILDELLEAHRAYLPRFFDD